MTDSIETSEDCAVHVPLTELEHRVNVANTEAFAAQASIGHLGRLVDELRAQRDELLMALALIVHATSPVQSDSAYHENAYELALAAINKVGDPL